MSKTVKYHIDCDCGHRIAFESKQPEGAKEPVICRKCYQIHIGKIPQREGKYLYKLRDKKYQMRLQILKVFNSYQEQMTVRQMFYRLVSSGYEKSESMYGKVQREMQKMRETGVLPFRFVADNTRSFYRPTTYNGLEDMLESSKQLYRRSLWNNVNEAVEVWLEKEALRGVFLPITKKYDVPLYVTKGFSSLSFVHEATQEIKHRDYPTYVYLFTDYDPSGLKVAENIKKRMNEFGAKGKAIFERAGLIQQQIDEYRLPSRPTKQSNHSKGWKGESVELDALEPQDLRAIVENCINQHIDQYQLQKMLEIEQAERQTLDIFINNFGQA